MDKNKNNFLEGKSCLFIGSPNCEYSKRCVEILRSYNLIITLVESSDRFRSIPSALKKWKGDFIFSYRNYWLLPKSLLDSAKILAINFHPGTPDFPGSGSYSWAIYQKAKKFGITVHIMNERFDNGTILKIYEFDIFDGLNVNQLIEMSKEFSVDAFGSYIKHISIQNYSSILDIANYKSPYSWSLNIRKIKDLDRMRRISTNLNEEEIELRRKAFHMEKYPLVIK